MSAASEAMRFSSTRQPESRGKTGRPRESRDKLTTDFLRAIADDFNKHGEQTIVTVRETDPAQYLRVVAAIIPKEIELRRAADAIDDDKLQKLIELLDGAIPAPKDDETSDGETIQ